MVQETRQHEDANCKSAPHVDLCFLFSRNVQECPVAVFFSLVFLST